MEWKTVYAVLFGGGISLVTSVALLILSNSINHRSNIKRETKAEALRAFQGLQKLLHSASAISSLDRLIEKQFKEAQNEEIDLATIDPSSIVTQIVGAPNLIEQLTVSETIFLTRSNDQELFSDVWEIQQRAMEYDHLVDEYNRLRGEYGDFLQALAPQMTGLTGTVASYDLTGDDAKNALVKTGQLNNLIGQIVERIERDKAQIRAICDRFIETAISEFGSDFPMKTIEWVEGEKTC